MRPLLALLMLTIPLLCCAQASPTSASTSQEDPAAPTAATPRERLTIEITTASGTGPGSIRAAIEAANAANGATRLVSMLPTGTEVSIVDALPALTAADSIFDANGLLLRGGTCMRPDGRTGCDGFLVRGPKIRVNRLSAHEFMFDGIAVRGHAAKDVRISDCHSFDNKDDGVGVSAGATEVVIERCVVERNGYRTKGKGILVFDHAQAELRDNLVRGNRDGVTISRRAKAHLVGNRIIENYDKGFGVAGADATGERNLVQSNGLGKEGLDPPPNGDGLRATLDSTVRLKDTVIADNGDSGVVVIGSAKLSLAGGRVSGNGGVGIRAAESGAILLEQVEVRDNRGGAHSVIDQARLDVGPRIAP